MIRPWIFNSPIWTGRRSSVHSAVPGDLKKKDGRYWVPIIALYSGMRAGEIIQLLRSDVQSENGIWYFDVTSDANGEDDGHKTLKTSSSYRRVPIHRTIIGLGFLDWIEQFPKGRIFADLPMGSDGTYSQLFSKFWGRYGKACGFYGKQFVFHSFRHNFVDALHEAHIEDSICHQLCGHVETSAHAGYGKGVSLKRLKTEIDKVAYPELDLSHLSGSEWS